jgi:hypothetical protein
MKFRATPTTAYHDLTESTTVPGTYELSDSTIEWPDGFFKFDFWSQLGGAKAPTTDDILTVTQNRIKITDDTIYATFQTTDVKNIVEKGVSDIITALGTVNTNLGTLEDDIEAMTAATPTIYNISIAVADTEYSQALPANAKRFSLSIIDGTPGENFRWAYETGKVATPTAPYRQLDQAFEYECDKINSSATIYVAASDVCTAQLEVWS